MSKRNFELNCEAGGKTEDDIVIALEEIIKKVKAGFTSGFNNNDSGYYEFQLSKER